MASNLFNRRLVWLLILACAGMVITILGNWLWASLYPRHVVDRLHTLQQGKQANGVPARGTDECFFFIFSKGIVKNGMHYQTVIDIIGEPNAKKFDPVRNEQMCFWMTTDEAWSSKFYLLTFAADGKADFVPSLKRVFKGIDGRTYAELDRFPRGMTEFEVSSEFFEVIRRGMSKD